jgi:lincosamide nucleotidyltransferase A/C/D/E
MTPDDVVAVLDRLDAAGIEWWVEGGWGVDALLGEQTRDHRDLDRGIHQEDAARVEATLAEYHRVETGEWPRFLVLDDEEGRRVDLTLAGAVHRDDAETRGVGRIAGRQVRCLSLDNQLSTARRLDAAVLRERFRP